MVIHRFQALLWGDPVPAWMGAAAFAVSGAWFASVALGAGRSRAEARHLAIASAAMVAMYASSTHSADPSGAPAGGGHAAHGLPGGGGAYGGSGVLLVALSLVLAGYFGWHAWSCTERSRVPGAVAASTATVRARTTPRAAPVAHAVMSALMAAMFLGVA